MAREGSDDVVTGGDGFVSRSAVAVAVAMAMGEKRGVGREGVDVLSIAGAGEKRAGAVVGQGLSVDVDVVVLSIAGSGEKRAVAENDVINAVVTFRIMNGSS